MQRGSEMNYEMEIEKKRLFVVYWQFFPKFEIGLKKQQQTNKPDLGMHANSN